MAEKYKYYSQKGINHKNRFKLLLLQISIYVLLFLGLYIPAMEVLNYKISVYIGAFFVFLGLIALLFYTLESIRLISEIKNIRFWKKGKNLNR